MDAKSKDNGHGTIKRRSSSLGQPQKDDSYDGH